MQTHIKTFIKGISLLLILSLITGCSLFDKPSEDTAKELLKDGKIDQAIEMYEKLLEDDEDNHGLWEGLVTCYFEDKDYEEAADVMEDWAEIIEEQYDDGDEGYEDAYEDFMDIKMDLIREDIDLFVPSPVFEDEPVDEKPVIYLYPETTTEVTVTLDYDGELFCTYPAYNNGWHVTAEPDGGLVNMADGKEYSYLFWEGVSDYDWILEEGFIVPGEDTVDFLQETLAYLGLTPEEYNEFIVYWLPRMQSNPYNLIYFAEEDYESLAELAINPTPDSIIRVFMVYKPLEAPVDIPTQVLTPGVRQGFTVIEWGGTELVD